MSFDVCILAGGRGTRLVGLWDGPKCLVPFKGRPLIEELINRALALEPRKIYLLLGHRASQVVAWREDCCPHRNVIPIIETEPLGTAGALRNAAPFLCRPVLVLNGDTLPGYNLAGLVEFRDRMGNVEAVVACHDGKYAGAAVLNDVFFARLATSPERDLDALLVDASRYRVPGFLDVGTPDGFCRVQHLKEEHS